MIYVSTGKVVANDIIVNKKELTQLEEGEKKPIDVKPAVVRRARKAQRMFLGREWREFKVKALGIDRHQWGEGRTAQEFKLGNSTIRFDAPKLVVKNAKGREAFKGSIPTSGDRCTEFILITKAWVIGEFHTMLFKLDNISTTDCKPEPGKYFVLKLE